MRNGVLEQWSDGVLGIRKEDYATPPLFQHPDPGDSA
jgi:hypothetical protein